MFYYYDYYYYYYKGRLRDRGQAGESQCTLVGL